MNRQLFLPQMLQQIRNSSTRFSYAKKQLLKNYKFPEIRPQDCVEQHIRGWGPGGSNVNSAGNAVLLKHIPTNCFVKVHDSRNLHENIEIARERLKLTVDYHLNGENSYKIQLKRLEKQFAERARRHKEKRMAKLSECRAEGKELLKKTIPMPNQGLEKDD